MKEEAEYKEIANTFAIEASRCYFTSRFVYLGGMSLMNGSGFFAQGAIEQYLKAVIINADGSKIAEVYKLRHNLKRLRQLAFDVTTDAEFDSEMFKSAVEYFDPFDQVGRYGSNANFDPLAKTGETFTSSGVSAWQPDYIPHLDYAVMVCRKHTSIEPKSMDLIAQIKARNTKSAVWKNWQLEGLRPDDVLFIENDYIASM